VKVGDRVAKKINRVQFDEKFSARGTIAVMRDSIIFGGGKVAEVAWDDGRYRGHSLNGLILAEKVHLDDSLT
jgi:hypothetical protein